MGAGVAAILSVHSVTPINYGRSHARTARREELAARNVEENVRVGAIAAQHSEMVRRRRMASRIRPQRAMGYGP